MPTQRTPRPTRRRTSRLTPNIDVDGVAAWEADDAAWVARGRQGRLFGDEHDGPPVGAVPTPNPR
jgi:hypothetical protein